MQLLSPYLERSTALLHERGTSLGASDFPAADVICKELEHALWRHCKGMPLAEQSDLVNLMKQFIEELSLPENAKDTRTDLQLRAVIGLCQTLAFLTHQPVAKSV